MISSPNIFPTPYRKAKSFRELRITILGLLRDSVLNLLGVFSAAFGLRSFLLPSQFIDGGATGISLLIHQVVGLPLPVVLILINIPFVLIGFRLIGLTFFIKTGISISLLAVAVAFFPFPELTQDKLLVAVFGGFFLGAGIGLSVRGGAVLDGTEVLAVALSRRLGMTIGDVILLINLLIFSTAAYLLNLETAMYSVLTYLSASKTVDFIIEGIEEYMGVTIISTHSDEIRQMIITKMGRGVTIYQGMGGYGKRGHANQIDIIYTVITRLELNRLRVEIEKVDPNAFIVMTNVKDIRGGMIKKRPLSGKKNA